MLETERGEVTRREALRRLGIGGALLLVPGALAACGSSGTGAARGKGTGGAGSDAEIDHVTWSLGATPPSLDIASGNLTAGVAAMALGLESLVTFDPQLRLKPSLAVSWSQPDPLRFVYKIRSGVRFWDGTPLTVDDVVYSLRRHIDPKVASQIAVSFASVRSIDATGRDEVTIRLKHPDPFFEYAPTNAFITPKAFSEKLGKRLGAAGSSVNTMGTGPFRITSFGDSAITVERNERYWGEKQRVRKATLTFISDPQANLLAMRAGEIDGIFEFSLQQTKDWDRLPNARTQYIPGATVVFLSFDMSMAPWNDIHVRRAIAHAADRAGYVKAFLGGHGQRAVAVAPPAQWSSVASKAEVKTVYDSIPDYPFDLTAAKRELAQSAYPNGFSAELSYPVTHGAAGRALVSLSQTLKGIGINLKVKEVPANTWLAKIYAHRKLGLQELTLTPDFNDPANYPAVIYASQNAVENNFNTANFKDPATDRLLAKQARVYDKVERSKAIAQVLRTGGELLPYLPLWWADMPMALNDKYVYEGFNTQYYYTNWLGNLRLRA